ncbi:MAG: epoxyqueuosine reductase QueH, partial [Deltaproteobacteria bacterium]
MKLLVHICCGPCAVYPLKKILDGKMDVWGFFYNPNIHPYTEYQKRLAAVKSLAEKTAIKMIYRDEYNLEEFLKNTINDIDARCGYCYSSRLEATAKAAKENGFDY